jgi:hypothetical protein
MKCSIDGSPNSTQHDGVDRGLRVVEVVERVEDEGGVEGAWIDVKPFHVAGFELGPAVPPRCMAARDLGVAGRQVHPERVVSGFGEQQRGPSRPRPEVEYPRARRNAKAVKGMVDRRPLAPP